MEKMLPQIEQFFEKALPSAGTEQHILALGEAHTHYEHLIYLKNHLDELKEKHRVRTIGLEISPYMNVLFDAYADGVLEEKLGSKEAAAEYIKQVRLLGGSNPKYYENISAETELAIAAIDKGMRVVCYDCRHNLPTYKNAARSKVLDAKYIQFDLSRAIVADNERLLSKCPELQQPLNPQYLRQLSGVCNEISASGYAFVAMQVEKVAALNPAYRRRLDAQQKFDDACTERGIPMDQRSALYLRSLSEKNVITLGGANHLSGMEDGLHAVDGTFGDYLERLKLDGRPPPNVITAVLASAAMLEKVRSDLDVGWI